MKIVGWSVTVVALLILSAMWSGYVLSVLWGWFLIPAFHIPSINIALAIGVSLVVRMLTSGSSVGTDEKEKDVKESLRYASVYAFIFPLFSLAFGAIVHAFL